MFDIFAKYWWQYLLLAVCCYLISTINYAVLFSRLIKKSDVRDYGSGNPGTTNMFRVYGLRMGTLTFLCDALKGVVCCLVGKAIFKSFGGADAATTAGYLAALFATWGHVFPVFYRFRGGKGVATSIGSMFALQPLFMVCCLVPFIAILLISDRVSVMSLALAFFVIVWSWVVWGVGFNAHPIYKSIDLFCCVLVTLLFATVIFAHRHNIVRICTGKEARTGLRKALRGKSDKIVK